MMRLTIKQHSVMMLISMLAIGALCVFLVIIPSYTSLLEQQKKIEDIHIQYEKQLSQTRLLRRSLSELHSTYATTKAIGSLVVPKGEALSVIDTLEQLAPQFGLSQDVTVSASQSDGVTTYTFSFVNKGPLQSHVSYIHALEQYPVFIRIDTVSFEDTSNGAQDILTSRFSATIYETSLFTQTP